MRYLCLYDHQCRFLFMSGASPGIDIDTWLGTLPWDHAPPEKVDMIKKHHTAIFAKGVDVYYYGTDYTSPTGHEGYYFHEFRWIGLPDVACSCYVWEFPAHLNQLTMRELDVLRAIGSGDGVKSAAKNIGLSASTVHTHMRNIREKLDLTHSDQLLAFASVYNDATEGGER